VEQQVPGNKEISAAGGGVNFQFKTVTMVDWNLSGEIILLEDTNDTLKIHFGQLEFLVVEFPTNRELVGFASQEFHKQVLLLFAAYSQRFAVTFETFLNDYAKFLLFR
jgi:hypothetical protein